MEDILVYREVEGDFVEIDPKYVKSMDTIRKYFDDSDLEDLVSPISGLTIYKIVPFARITKNTEYKIETEQ